METLLKTLFFLACVGIALSLTSSEEARLVLHSDSSLIDEKLRELPGGVLVPPEIGGANLEFDRYQPVQGPKFVRNGGDKGGNLEERLKSAVVKSIRRLQTYSHHQKPPKQTSFSRSTYSLPSQSISSHQLASHQLPPQTSSSLEIALKRIEILSSRAGFNMSALPRRTQLQIVSKLTPKLPTKLQAAVKSAIKSNSPKIYEFLPEPSRDPLIEDNPSFLSDFMDVEEEILAPEVIATEILAPKRTPTISLTTDNHPPEEVYQEEQHQMAPPAAIEGSYSTNYERRIKFEEDEKLPTAEPLKGSAISDPQHSVDDDKGPDNTDRTIKITRSRESSKPIRVSIISKEVVTTTTEKPTPVTKIVQVKDFTSNATQLFQLENDEGSDYSDLSSAEIEAMVTELERFEGNELSPHELEFPDHPEHPKEKDGAKEEAELERLRGEIIEGEKRKQVQGQQMQQRQRPPPTHPHLIRRPPLPPRPNHRPHPPHSPYFRGPRPQLINEVKVKEAPKEFDKECDYFSGEVCLLVQDYPIEAITQAMDSAPSLALSLLPREDQEPEKQAPANSKLSSEGGFLCPSKVAYGKVKKAKSSTNGKWKFVVNYGDKTQTLRLEKCLTPGDKCSYVMPQYRTACTQVYNYHRLLAWDHENGLHIDVFKVPVTCTCSIQGYYSPFNTQQKPPPPPPQPQSRRRMSTPPNHQHHQQQFPLPRMHVPRQRLSQGEDLHDLLKQYAVLRDKIAKRKSGDDRISQLSSRIDDVLKRKKRKNGGEKSVKPDLSKLLKKIKSKNKKLTKKEVLAVAKRRLRMMRSGKVVGKRAGRNLKQKDKKISKNKKLLRVLKAIKKKKEVNKKKNYNYHPIMEYIK